MKNRNKNKMKNEWGGCEEFQYTLLRTDGDGIPPMRTMATPSGGRGAAVGGHSVCLLRSALTRIAPPSEMPSFLSRRSIWLAFVVGLLIACAGRMRAADPSLVELEEKTEAAWERTNFRALEKIVKDGQPADGSMPICRDGQTRLTTVIFTLDKYKVTEDLSRKKTEAMLDGWRKALPDSAHWRIYLAYHLGGMSLLSSNENAADDWEKAATLLDEAEAKVGRVPDWYCSYLRLAFASRRLLKNGRLAELPPKFDDWLSVAEEGMKLFPDHSEIWHKGAFVAVEIGFPGSVDGWNRHLCKLLPERGWEPYARQWWSQEFRYPTDLFSDKHADWPTFREGFFGMLKRYPESKRLVAKFIEFCRKADDTTTAQKLLPLLGENPGPEAFPVSVRFLEIRDWALGHANVRTPLWNRKGAAWSVAWSKDGELLYAGVVSRLVPVLNAKNGEQIRSLVLVEEDMRRSVNDIAVSPDGKLVAAVNGSHNTKIPGTCRIWQTDSFEEKASFHCKAGPLRTISWAPDSTRLIATGGVHAGPGEAWLWQDGADADGMNVKDAKYHSVEASSWAPDNSKLFFNHDSGRIIVAEPGKEMRNVKQITVPISTWVTSIRCSPDGKWVAVACGGSFADQYKANGGVTIFHAADMEPIKDGKAPLTGGLLTVDWSPDGKWLACAGYDGYVYVLDSATLELKTWWNAQQQTIRKLRWSPDGTRLATATDGGGVSVWKVW